MTLTYRQLTLAVFICSIGAAATSFFSQYVLKLNPCPLCILQRIAVLSVMLVSGITLLMPSEKKGARLGIATLISIPAIWGFYVAAYQIWLQSLPVEAQPSCGAPWVFRLKDWFLFDYWKFIVKGFGNCGVREYLLGVPLPVWSILFFGAVLIALWAGLWKLRR